MTAPGRRSILLASMIVPAVSVPLALAVNALPDARFVGFAQAVNDFDIASGQLALARSSNENIRGYATRAMADAKDEAEALRLSRSEAGVSYAPDGSMGPKTANLLTQLQGLQGPAFDTAYASHNSPSRPTRKRSTAPTRRTARAARCGATLRPAIPCHLVRC